MINLHEKVTRNSSHPLAETKTVKKRIIDVVLLTEKANPSITSPLV
jgi:hypothetical protein